MKKFRRCTHDSNGEYRREFDNDPFVDWATEYGAGVLHWVSNEPGGMTLEDIVENIQRDDLNWPPGSKPGRGEIADSLCALLMAGLVEMV